MSDSRGSKVNNTRRQQRGKRASSPAAQECGRQNIAASKSTPVHFSDAPNGLMGMAADISNLFSSFEILAGDPDNATLRHNVVRGAQAIAAQFNRAATRLSGVEYGLNTSIQKDVVRANYHLHDIGCFNEQIIDTLAVGGETETWASQREKCMDALGCCATLVPVPQANGSINISIGGVTMVTGAEMTNCLATYPDLHGNLLIQAQNNGVPLRLSSGSIARKIAVRDGQLADLRRGLDTLAAQLITRVNALCQPAAAFFAGRGASDIAVNSTAAGDPLPLPTGATAEEDGNRMVALALAKLGSRKFLGFGPQPLHPNPAPGASDLDEALAIVNDNFNPNREATPMQALGAALEGETANFMRYQQACASSARVISTLEEMGPMR